MIKCGQNRVTLRTNIFRIMMKKEELIKQCRYYKGEERSPYDRPNLDWYWEMERVYVVNNGEFEGERDLYNAIEGRRFPGIPFSLLIVMFTSWAKWVFDAKSAIPAFYEKVEDYLFVANDHYPEDKIPS